MHKCLKVAFIKLGFKSKQAFYNICKSLDASITNEELYLFWYLEACSESLFIKIDNVINNLRHE